MKQVKKKIIWIMFLGSIVLFLLFRGQTNANYFQDELIFFQIKKGEIGIKERREIKQITLDLKNENRSQKEINLLETISSKTFINEKVAPGTEGKFEIILEGEEKTNYQLFFETNDQNPKNLKFGLKPEEIQKNLKELEQQLQGTLEGRKTILIYWKWPYEINKEENKQDTKDGIEKQQYRFTIYAIRT